ncbi:MAG TPA: hypothetical protein VMU47_05015 [Caldimonas sp.]|nr:hypothetical protein [Caldimonas sp.]
MPVAGEASVHPPAVPLPSVLRAYRNVGYWLLLLPVVIAAGFWVPNLSQAPHFPARITPTVHAHALLLFTWLALLVLQPLLIRSHQMDWHRLLGRLTYILVPLVVAFAIAVIGKDYRDEIASGMTAGAARDSEYLASGGVVLIILFYGLAMLRIRQRNVGAHLRYVVCSAIVLLPAGLSRLLGFGFDIPQGTGQIVSFAAIDLVLLGLIAYDRRHGLSHRPYALALVACALFEGGWTALGFPV